MDGLPLATTIGRRKGSSSSSSTMTEKQQPLRRSKSRQVSSRYMSPTVSSMAARSASPVSRKGLRLSNADSDFSSRPASAERRRPITPDSINSNSNSTSTSTSTSTCTSPGSHLALALARARARAALWPSAASSENFRAPLTHHRLNNNDINRNGNINFVQVQVNVRRRKSSDSDALTASSCSSSISTGGGGRISRSSSSWHMRKSSASASEAATATAESPPPPPPPAVARLSFDLGRRGAGAGDDFFSTISSSDGGCSTPRDDLVMLVAADDDDENHVTAPPPVEEDTENIPAETALAPEAAATTGNKKIIRGSYVPARFLQDTLSRLRRLSDTGGGGNTTASALKHKSDRGTMTVVSAIRRTKSSVSAVTAKGVAGGAGAGAGAGRTGGAAGVRPHSAGSRVSNMIRSLGGVGVELLKGRRSPASAAHDESLHQLRLMHNRFLQWRFVNARSRSALASQTASAHSSLYNVFCKTAQVRASVAMKRIQLQKLRHQNKLQSVLSAFTSQLEDWEELKEEHMSTVSEAIDCLDAATLRVPLVNGAKADAGELKQVMAYTMQLMHGIQAALSGFNQQADTVGVLLPQLAETVSKENALLQHCLELLSHFSSVEAEERSLKAHLIQLHQAQQRQMSTKAIA